MQNVENGVKDGPGFKLHSPYPLICVSAETEAEGPGAGRQHQAELEEAGRWKSLPQGRQEDQQEEEEEGGAVMLSCCVCFHQRKVWFFPQRCDGAE